MVRLRWKLQKIINTGVIPIMHIILYYMHNSLTILLKNTYKLFPKQKNTYLGETKNISRLCSLIPKQLLHKNSTNTLSPRCSIHFYPGWWDLCYGTPHFSHFPKTAPVALSFTTFFAVNVTAANNCFLYTYIQKSQEAP